jgi:AraC-like DNA-binding protein
MAAAARKRFRMSVSIRNFLEHLHIQRRFFLSYLLVLIAPLTVALLLYPSAAGIIERKEMDTRAILIQDCVITMDQAMRHIDSALVDISRDAALNRLLLQPQPGYGSSSAALVYEVHDALSSKLSYADLPADIVIYMTRPDLAMDGGSVIYGRSRYYDLAISYEGMEYAAFDADVLSRYHYHRAVGPYTIIRKKTSMNPDRVTREDGFLYLQTLPVVGGLQNNLGAAVVHIGSELLETLSWIHSDEDGGALIADAELNVLTSFGVSITNGQLAELELAAGSGSLRGTISGQRMLITYARSSYNGWYYLSASPLSAILRSLYTLRVILTACVAAILAIGVSLSAYLSRSSARPYEDALEQLAAVTRGGSTSGDLHNAVNALLSDREEMRAALNRARLASRESFLEELFRGELNDDEAILGKASGLGMNLSGAAYSVAILSPPNESDSLTPDVMIMLSEYVSRAMRSARAYTHALPRRRIGLALCFDQPGEQYARSAAAELAAIVKGADLAGGHTGGMSCYVGGIVARPSFLCVSYSEAEAALAADGASRGSVCGARSPTHYREVAWHNRGFVYPSEIENKMALLCAGGNKARLNETLDYIYEENFVKRSMDRRMAYALFSDMYATLIKIAGMLSLSWMPQSFYSMRMGTLNHTVEFERVRASFDRLADLYAERQSLASSTVGAPVSNTTLEMELYIREQYSRSDMSVAVMADRFRVSETYFSEYFKRSTGQTFSAFLETTRINNACQKLRQTSLPIEEIASETGYTSALSFRRAFKKVTGVSPTEYRRGLGTIV